ncbi:MAG TPA: SH3 domain-containing protein [candidate division Zixibacteria bacterium]|nr:SH3 domain-containing protein [candidate division Zixibacteria bacterium]
MIAARKSWASLAFLVVLLSMSACKKAEQSAGRDDLPDLNAQMRPYVTVEGTRVRTGPGPQFRPVAEVPRKARVYVVGRDGDWALIVSKKGNPPGFVELAALEPATGDEPEPPARSVEGSYETLANTQVRSGPGLHYPVVAEVAKGTKIHVVDEEKGWFKVVSKRGNKPGYVDSGMVKPMSER